MIRARIAPVLLLTVALMILLAGCNKDQTPRSDSQVASDITNKINSDANLPNKGPQP